MAAPAAYPADGAHDRAPRQAPPTAIASVQSRAGRPRRLTSRPGESRRGRRAPPPRPPTPLLRGTFASVDQHPAPAWQRGASAAGATPAAQSHGRLIKTSGRSRLCARRVGAINRNPSGHSCAALQSGCGPPRATAFAATQWRSSPLVAAAVAADGASAPTVGPIRRSELQMRVHLVPVSRPLPLAAQLRQSATSRDRSCWDAPRNGRAAAATAATVCGQRGLLTPSTTHWAACDATTAPPVGTSTRPGSGKQRGSVHAASDAKDCNQRRPRRVVDGGRSVLVLTCGRPRPPCTLHWLC